MNAALKYDILDFGQEDYEQYTYQDDTDVLKSVHAISLGDLMGESHDIWIQKNNQFGFDIEIGNEDAEPILIEKGIHPCAIESFAEFCRHFLHNYNRFKEVVA